MTDTLEADHLAATRAVYDTVAADYAVQLKDLMAAKPFERALLAAFADLVRDTGPGGQVADIGCGPGRVTGHLHGLGLDVFGVDLSPGMVAVARRTHPEIRFTEGTMTALDLQDASLGGLCAWYCVVHTPPALLRAVFAEFHRVLAPGAPFVLAFKAGADERFHRTRAYGHDVEFDVHWNHPDTVAGLLTAAGLAIEARMVCEPNADERPTQGQQGYMVGRRPR